MLRSCFIYLHHRQLLLRLVLQGIRLLLEVRQKEASLHLFLHLLLDDILDNIHRLALERQRYLQLVVMPLEEEQLGDVRPRHQAVPFRTSDWEDGTTHVHELLQRQVRPLAQMLMGGTSEVEHLVQLLASQMPFLALLIVTVTWARLVLHLLHVLKELIRHLAKALLTRFWTLVQKNTQPVVLDMPTINWFIINWFNQNWFFIIENLLIKHIKTLTYLNKIRRYGIFPPIKFLKSHYLCPRIVKIATAFSIF